MLRAIAQLLIATKNFCLDHLKGNLNPNKQNS